jgi:hypothetical protein
MSDLAKTFLGASQRVFLAKEAAANELAWSIVRELHGGSIPPGPLGTMDRKVERLADALKDLID